MSRRCLFVFLLVTTGSAARSGAAEPNAATPAAIPFALRLWSITDLVLDHHIDPPARQQMLLTAVRELLAKNDKPIPPELGRKFSAVTTPEQLDALLKDIGSDKAKPESESAAIEGMLASVPGRADLLTPEDVKSAGVVAANNYVGIGIQIRMHEKEKLAQIVVAFPGGPFRRAGGKANDLIVEVNGKSMAGVILRDVVLALRGEDGTEVTVLVRQPASTETRLIKMIREVVPFDSAVGYRQVSEESFDFRPEAALPAAYVRLERLSGSTYHELRRLERQLRSEGNRALVLDLRGTRAGSLVHAAQVADAFLDGGPMWKVRDARGRITEYKADRDCLFRDWPIVVLINEMTVETPALIAAALQDRGRAVLVGSPTSGGVTVKSLVLLPDGTGAVNMTTGIVERIKSHKDTDAAGPAAGIADPTNPRKGPLLRPDHVVPLSIEKLHESTAWQLHHSSDEPPGKHAPKDIQLEKALELLRPMLKEKGDAVKR
jgi:carboxyl-terminal processing protease